ncbi:MAG: DUF2062 domain-containing protein [Bacteroidetes bacterium]|nr:DUF2062 domain-containing protein [Bacteroidota bacterium]
MKAIKVNIKAKLLGIRKKLVSIKADPKKICLGYALGIFLAATPFIGVKVPIAILLTHLLKWNKVASVIGVFHINILTGPLFYGFSYLVGKFILHPGTGYYMPQELTVKTCLALITDNSTVFTDLLAGGFILGLPMAFAAYLISSSFFRHHPSNKPHGYEKQFPGTCLLSRL